MLFFSFFCFRFSSQQGEFIFKVECLTLLLVVVSFIFYVNGRAFDVDFTSSSDSDEVNQSTHFIKIFRLLQDLVTYQVIVNNPLNLHSSDNDFHHEYKLGQISELAGCVKNPNRLIVLHRGSREWNQE